MAKLEINQDGVKIEERILTPGRLTIGRKSSNHIRVPSPTISARHALVITIRNESYLEDLNSTNGTRVNGKIIKKCLLQNGDEITLAKHLLKYISEEIPPQERDTTTVPSTDAESRPRATKAYDDATIVIQNEALPSAPSPQSSTQKITESVGSAAIYLLSGPGMGNEIPLDRTLTTFGKPGIQVAVIIRRKDGYFFSHVDGAYAPTVNGVSINTQARKLNDHDIIELADTKMEFFVK